MALRIGPARLPAMNERGGSKMAKQMSRAGGSGWTHAPRAGKIG